MAKRPVGIFFAEKCIRGTMEGWKVANDRK
jgi:hypothetical protein